MTREPENLPATKKDTARAVRRKTKDRVWSDHVAARTLEIVANTGSPKIAAQKLNVSVATIMDHRARDPEFGEKYRQAMDAAFHNVVGRAFELSLDEENPSERLIEVLMKFRWPDRLATFLMPANSTADAKGLNPAVIARMSEGNRKTLMGLLEKYLEVESTMNTPGVPNG